MVELVQKDERLSGKGLNQETFLKRDADMHWALNERFDEVNTELLFCMSRLNPSDRFSDFDKGLAMI